MNETRRGMLKSTALGLFALPLALFGCGKKKDEEPVDGRIPEGSAKVFPRNSWECMELSEQHDGSELKFVVGQSKARGPFGGHKEVIVGGDSKLLVFFNNIPIHGKAIRYTDMLTLELETKEDMRFAKEILDRLPHGFALSKEQAALCRTMSMGVHQTDLPEDEPREPYGLMAQAVDLIGDIYREAYDVAILIPHEEKLRAEIDQFSLDREKRATIRKAYREVFSIEPTEQQMKAMLGYHVDLTEADLAMKRAVVEEHIQSMLESLPWEVPVNG